MPTCGLILAEDPKPEFAVEPGTFPQLDPHCLWQCLDSRGRHNAACSQSGPAVLVLNWPRTSRCVAPSRVAVSPGRGRTDGITCQNARAERTEVRRVARWGSLSRSGRARDGRSVSRGLGQERQFPRSAFLAWRRWSRMGRSTRWPAQMEGLLTPSISSASREGPRCVSGRSHALT